MINSNLKPIILVAVFISVFVIGLIILMDSTSLGSDAASDILRANGGSMDTNTYLIYLEQSIMKYRLAGAIISILGGLGVLIKTTVKAQFS